MINGVHAILYCEDAEAARSFFRDVLGWPDADAGRGWLIFGCPPSEIAAHPAGDGAESGRHELYFMCDDLQATMDALKKKGVKFTMEPADQGWGIVSRLEVPGGGEIGVYQPRHPRPPAAK